MHPFKFAARSALTTFFALALLACTSLPHNDAGVAATPPPQVLLVSLDGFRPDYLELDITPNLKRISEHGVQAEWMTPSYPSLTFPNHFTIVTGKRPDHHGIVHNSMRDPALGKFSLGNREAVSDGRWWDSEPIWVTVEKAGLRAGTMFWPGSEAAIGGVHASHWKTFDAEMPMADRVDTVLAWLAEPEATRPRFSTLYFEAVDSAAHANGPDSEEAHAAIRDVDAAMGRLLDGIDALGLASELNVVVVSDHGMATVPPDQFVVIEDMVDPADAEFVTAGQSVGFTPRPGRRADAESQLLGAHENYDCWRKDELPQRWQYGAHPRVPPIICQMHEGYDALRRAWLETRSKTDDRGSHGFDPALPSMRAIFLARGPAFLENARVPAFDNIDVYPLLMAILEVEPAANDGGDGAMESLKPGAGRAAGAP